MKVLVVITVALLGAACGVHAAPAAGDGRESAAQVRTERITEAARSFIATLDDAQKKVALYAFSDAAQRTRWSNFPDGAASRAGVRWGQLSAIQQSALTTLLATVLSPKGAQMVVEQMAADDVLKTMPSAGPPGPPGGAPGRPGGPRRPGGPGFGPGGPGGPGGPPGGGAGGARPPVNFGSAWYYVAFIGTPSATAPWMFQFGGHHLAINATVVGPRVTLSPSLTGGEPLKFVKDGERVYIVEDEVTQSMAMLDSLTPAQRTKAIVNAQRIDLVLGPGHDGQVLQPEGLSGSEMTEAQKTRFLALIEARLGVLNADHLTATMVEVRSNLARTSLAWFGPAQRGAAYFRIVGPTVLIEFSPQDDDGDATDHAHNMYRDPTNEYGAAWTSLE